MKKIFIVSLLLLSSLSLFGCNDDKSAEKIELFTGNSTENSSSSTEISNSNKKNDDFIITETYIEPSPFILKDTTLIFPNWDDNNKISFVTAPDKNIKFTNKDIGEFLDYSTNSMTLFQNELFFANGNNNYKLSKFNLTSKELTTINNFPIKDICNDAVRLFYINTTTNELFAYNTLDDVSIKLTTDKVGKFIVNGSNVFYQNASDGHKLYRISVDGTYKQALTKYPVDSFVTFKNDIYFINSADNNALYHLNTKDLTTRRVATVAGTNLKVFNDKLLFVDIKDSNKLKSIDIDLEKNTFKTSIIVDDSINEYHIIPTGIFFRKSIDVNSPYYFIVKK